MKSLSQMLVLAQKAEKSFTARDNALSIVETECVSVLKRV
jgi:hypothetical protein